MKTRTLDVMYNVTATERAMFFAENNFFMTTVCEKQYSRCDQNGVEKAWSEKINV